MDQEKLREMIENKGLTQEIAAKEFEVQHQTISKWCKKFGIKTHRTGPRSGEGHPDWKGGIRIVGRYRYLYSPAHPNRTRGKAVAEHRLVMEQKIGRYLGRKEVVHHIDRNPLNNHPDNLELFENNGKHLHHERKGKVPNWSEEGKARISYASRNRSYSYESLKKMSDSAKTRKSRRRMPNGHYALESDVYPQPQ